MEAYRAQGIDAGTAEILEIERKNPGVAGWAKYLREAEFQQCDTCKVLDFDDIATQVGYTLEGRGQKHHRSWDSLRLAAESGCHTCRLFHLVKLHEDRRSALFSSVDNGLTHVRVTKDHTINLDGPGTMSIRFAWSTLSDCPVHPLSSNERNGKRVTRFIEDNPGSPVAFARAQSWINHCLANHKYCRKNDSVPLPTRVLHVEAASTTGRVRLFEMGGLLSKYVALSHCWGNSGEMDDNLIRTCTTSNYQELKDGFELSRIPRNFQDAILVANKLSIPYVWIDSFCIIQDSIDDWSRESLGMSEVYGSSFLTIYASSAASSDVGFLQPRDRERYLMTKLCPIPTSPSDWIWIRWPPYDSAWSIDEAVGKLWNRSWAFQELVLSPRILEYSPQTMQWRCNEQHIEESAPNFDRGSHDGYKELMWILGDPDVINQSPKAILSHPTFADHHEQMNIYHRWYQLIEGFAGRELTYDTDKLPAISGLASKIQQMTGDVYMAGLWKQDLAAGLCWGARSSVNLTRYSEYVAPSWSWASTKGHINHRFIGRKPERRYNIELIRYELATETLNPLGQVYSGSITVNGSMRRFDVTKNTVHINEEWDTEAEKSRPEIATNDAVEKYDSLYLYPLKDQHDIMDPTQGGICSMSFDVGPPDKTVEVWLLKMVVPMNGETSKKWESALIPDGIVVESVIKGGNVCRRIGVYACEDAMADWIDGSQSPALLGWQKRTITII